MNFQIIKCLHTLNVYNAKTERCRKKGKARIVTDEKEQFEIDESKNVAEIQQYFRKDLNDKNLDKND